MSSDELTDEGKRRREEGEDDESDPFKRSRRVERSPEKTGADRKIDRVMKLLEDLASDVKDIKREQGIYAEEIRALREENKKIMKENEEIKKENEQAKRDVRNLTSRVEYLEKESKKDNVVITGVKIDTQDSDILKEVMENLIEKTMNIKVDIKTAVKLGEEKCLLHLETADKRKVMQNKKKLRDFKEERIYINDDLTVAEMEMKSELRKKAQEARSEGKAVKLGFRKLIIEGKTWRWNRKGGKLDQPRN
uniref:Uncharacterized protein LOC114338714 n=1 Tax=Diabrotica virgifera virgifera TaxID=50390 RepID=A0A6P7G7N1_DIAVI